MRSTRFDFWPLGLGVVFSGSYRMVKVIFLVIWLLFQVLALGTLIVIPIDVLGREWRLCYKYWR